MAVRPQPAPLFEPGAEHRTSRRVELYPHAAEVLSGKPPRARRSKRADVAIAWTAAGAASAALGLGAWLGGVPDLGLGAVLCFGLAVIRTVVVVREKRPAAATV
ncbi:MAG: hypothetical protein IMZ66_01865 [Planctomycetes bacterium]|nr:hypothetical protein [Planctomycetota bacterium]